MQDRNVDLSVFTKKVQNVVSDDPSSWNGYYGRRRVLGTKDYSIEEIERIINSGDICELQKLSRNYYDKNGLYKRIILYYATLLKYSGLLVPNPTFGKKLSENYIQKKYFAALEYLDKLNIPELFTRISIKALVDGCYYGVILSLDKEELTIIDLPSGYCRNRFKDLKGNDLIEFNVDFFYQILDKEMRKQALKSYPKEISSYFKRYDAGKEKTSWVLIPAEIGVCFSIYEDARPLFLDVIPAVEEYDDAVDREKERDLEEIKKIIVQKIPHLNDGQLLFEPPEALEMHQGAVNMMKGNKNLSILTTYADVDSIISKTASDNVNNSLEKMLQNVYSDAGVSAQVFAPTGSQALATSIVNDLALMMILGNKYSRFISFILNTLFSNNNVDFNYYILPVSYYNQKDFIDQTLKMAQSGYSLLLPSIAAGVNQRDLMSVKDLENNVLNLKEVLIPLSSSYTETNNSKGDGKVGAPELPLEEKSEKTIKNEESLDRQGGIS